MLRMFSKHWSSNLSNCVWRLYSHCYIYNQKVLQFQKSPLPRSCKTKSTITGDSGKAMGLLNFCLYNFLLKKWKKSKFNCNIFKNSSLGIIFMSHSEEICIHLLEKLSKTWSSGMFVNKNTTSKETKTKSQERFYLVFQQVENY